MEKHSKKGVVFFFVVVVVKCSFVVIELLAMAVFTIDYVVRFVLAPNLREFIHSGSYVILCLYSPDRAISDVLLL